MPQNSGYRYTLYIFRNNFFGGWGKIGCPGTQNVRIRRYTNTRRVAETRLYNVIEKSIIYYIILQCKTRWEVTMNLAQVPVVTSRSLLPFWPINRVPIRQKFSSHTKISPPLCERFKRETRVSGYVRGQAVVWFTVTAAETTTPFPAAVAGKSKRNSHPPPRGTIIFPKFINNTYTFPGTSGFARGYFNSVHQMCNEPMLHFIHVIHAYRTHLPTYRVRIWLCSHNTLDNTKLLTIAL